MNDFKFVSDRYDIKNTSNYRLSIQINRDGFSVLIKDANKEVLQLWHSQTDSLENSVSQLYEHEELDAIRRLDFSENLIKINNTSYSLVPENLFDLEKQSFILENSVQLASSDIIENDFIPEIKARIVYKIDSEFQAFIKLFKNNPKIKHISGSLIYAFISRAIEPVAFNIYDAGEIVHIGVLKGKKLSFFNSFPRENINETIYYCINAQKKLNLPTITKFFYSGVLNPDCKEFQHLKKYFPGIEIISNPLPFEIAGQHNENYYINLI